MSVEHGTEPSAVGLGGRRWGWHSNRWLSPLVGLVVALAIPWGHVSTIMLSETLTFAIAVSLAWAIPTWRMGVVAHDGGVRFTGVLLTQRFHWDEIESARIARIGIEPRLRLDLIDGDQVWAPGFRIPYSQASSRQDGWQSTEMYRAARVITEEAELRRRRQPPDGTVVPMPRVQPAGALSTAA